MLPLILFLVICVIIILSFYVKNGGATEKEKFYCVGKSSRNNDTMRRELICHELIIYLDKTISNQLSYNFFKNYIFMEGGYPSFKNNDNLEFLKYKVENYNKGGDISATKKKFREIEKKYGKINIGIVQGPCFWKIPVKPIPNRDFWKYKYTEEEKQIVSLKYANMNDLSPGDQWSLYSGKDIEKLIEDGFLIEAFGSTFNARLRYFGSISEVDEPFGRLGTYDEIMHKILAEEEILWRDQVVNDGREPLKFTANTPSSGFIQYKTLCLAAEILEKNKRKIDIIIHVSNIFYEKFKERDKPISERLNLFIKREKLETEAYSLYDNSVKNMVGREWILLVCRNY